MHYDPTLTQKEMLAAVRQDAQTAYGPERATELDEGLVDLAQALWRVGRVELDLIGTEPDFGG